tara:strand:+ start:1014 stop:1271 length:258 start_codon:yes stop_codon:yes gene_type:complete
MAHFAHIDENNIVTEVLVVPDEQEHRGEEYLNELGLEGRWIQTSYNDNIRGSYAGIGDYYNEEIDMFEIRNYVNWLEYEDDINGS